MINAILGMSFTGLVDLVISSVFFYHIISFFIILLVFTVIAVKEKDWYELKKLIGWYFLVAYGILFGVSILAPIISFILPELFTQNGVQVKTVLIASVVCFALAEICWKIGDNLAFGEEHKWEKEHGSAKEIQKLTSIIGFKNWNTKLTKEENRKLRNKEKIVYIDKELLY
jgi:glucan phosphoethanolaminetransferase (alkaline phosphatase superfamily)